jgi:hypothetical protein
MNIHNSKKLEPITLHYLAKVVRACPEYNTSDRLKDWASVAECASATDIASEDEIEALDALMDVAEAEYNA